MPCRCVRNVVVFDPDVVYAFTSPIIEVDHLCRCDEGSKDDFCRILGARGYVVVEDVSDENEPPVKTAKRALLTLAKVPSIVWRFPKDREGDSGSRERSEECEINVRPVDVMLFGELINAAFYWQLFMSDRVGGFNAIENIYKTLGELFGSSGVKGEDVGPYELLSLLRERSDTIYEQAVAFVSESLNDLRNLCKANVWAVLIQKGVEEYRFGSICRSIQMLKELCVNALKSGEKPGSNVYYILSPEALGFLERRAGEKRGKARECRKKKESRDSDVLDILTCGCEPKPEKKFVDHSCKELPQNEGSHLLVLTRVQRIDVIGALRCINEVFGSPVVFVFGDYDKDALETIIRNGLASQIAVVNEAFYGVATDAEYAMHAYYGYLKGIDIDERRQDAAVVNLMRKIKGDERLRSLMENLGKEVCQGLEGDVRDVCLYKVPTLLLKLITVIPVQV